MKKTITLLVTAVLLSFGVAYADEAKKVETAKPADKAVAEAPMAAEAAPAPAAKAKVHHHKKATTKMKATAGAAAPAAATEAKPAEAAPKMTEAPKK